ncbi:hypothetical protein B0I72DRAFT_45825 [Yarrowia lipolytica]|jgi:uncharacterized protein YecA (UPF0149 family)|nr:hypothetical protein B0I72DRAFT_45825 [Yarrowia lipolytica]VBB85577.1 Conserved hypothetical protein [Yarrowia lipolytica]
MNKKTKQQKLETIHDAHTNLVTTLKTAPEALEKPLLQSIALIHTNHKNITNQAQHLEESTEKLTKLNKQLQTVANNGDTKLRETGDVQNWAEMVDANIRMIEKTIQIRRQNQL